MEAGVPQVPEVDIPDVYTLKADTELPLRQIDNLAIFRSREDGSREMCTLDEALELEPLRLGGARPGGRGRAAQREAPRVSMTGVLHCLGEEEAGHPPLRVELGPPRDWCIEHDQLPCIWIVTDHGWYRVARTDSAFSRSWWATQRKFDLATRAARAAEDCAQWSWEDAVQASLVPDQVVPELGSAENTSFDSQGTYSRTEVQEELSFIYWQLKALAGAGRFCQTVSQGIAAMDSLPAPPESRLGTQAELYRAPTGRDTGAHRARESPPRARPFSADLNDAQSRGPPPPLHRAFKSPPELRGDILAIWDLTQSFGALLGIPPMPLWRLEAALCQETSWLSPPERSTGGPAPERPGHDEHSTWEMEMERANLLQMAPLDLLQKRLRQEAGGADATVTLAHNRPDWDAGGDPASADPPGASTFALGAWGHDAMANAAVLSDVHAGLLRVMDLPEDAISAMPPRPNCHRAVGPPQSLWVTGVIAAVGSAPTELVSKEAYEALRELQTKDYFFLSSAARVALLKALADVAVMSPAFRRALQARTEDKSAMPTTPDLQPPARAQEASSHVIGAPAPSPVIEGLPATWRQGHAAGSSVSPTLPVLPEHAPALVLATPKDPEHVPVGAVHAPLDAWAVRALELGAGANRPLGSDFFGRRFWALGATTGVTRVYVENPSMGSWGWYEAHELAEVALWVRRGGIAGEARLAEALDALASAAREASVLRGPAGGSASESAWEAERGGGSAHGAPSHGPGVALGLMPAAHVATDSETGAVAGYRTSEEDADRFKRPGRASLEMSGRDGYEGVVCPFLWGCWESDVCDLTQPPLRTLQSALGATLAALPFWEQDAALGSRVVEIANQCAAMLRELGERGMLEAPPAALTALAESLASTHHLSPSFAAIHRAWSAHASAVRTTEDALRSLLVLQHYVSVPELIRRDVFLALGAESQGARYCPGPGDQVAVAITGAAAHVAHFLDNIPAGHALLRRLQDMLQAGEYAGIYRVALVAFYGGLKSGNILTDRPPGRPQRLDNCDGLGPLALLGGGLYGFPACWVLLQPLEHIQAPPLALPIHIGGPGPDFLVRKGIFSASMRVPYAPGDAVRLRVLPVPGKGLTWIAGRVVSARPGIRRQSSGTPRGASEAAGAAGRGEGEDRGHAVEGGAGKDSSYVERGVRKRVAEGEGVGRGAGVGLRAEADAKRSRGGAERTTSVAESPSWAGDPLRAVLGSGVGVGPSYASAVALRGIDAASHEPAGAGAVAAAPVPMAGLTPTSGSLGELGEARGVEGSPGASSGSTEGAGPSERRAAVAADPWLSLEVEWEAGDSRSRSAPTQVCPWDVEPGHDAAGTGTTARGHAQAMNRGLSALLAAKRAAAEGPDTPGPYPGHAPTRVVPRPVAPAAVAQIGALFGAQGPGTAAPSLPAAFANAIAEHPCARVSDAVLATIGSRDRFLDLLSSYHRWHGLRLKVPTFAYAELDLWTVFVEVARRGGYAAVTNSKMWKAVCDKLRLDLRGQTSASYSMRNNYERCLLPFENHLIRNDLEGLTNFPHTPSFHAQTPAAILDPHTSEGDAVIAAREARKGPPKEDAPGLARRYPKLAQFGTTFLAMKDFHESPTIGADLVSMGRHLVGYLLWRFWEDFEQWFPAVIADFNYETGEHLLVYDVGSEEESMEWADLREFKLDELRCLKPRSASSPMPPRVSVVAGPVPPADEDAPRPQGRATRMQLRRRQGDGDGEDELE